MSNFLVLCSDKVIHEIFWNNHRREANNYYCRECSSYFVECNSKSLGLNEPELIKCTYKLESPIYFELEDETKRVREVYTETKKLLLWLYDIVNELINKSFVIKLIKVNNGNDENIMVYEQNIDLSYLLKENVVFDSYVIYCIDKNI